jgi:acyl dehydratase
MNGSPAMHPRCPNILIISWIAGKLTRECRCMSASAGGMPSVKNQARDDSLGMGTARRRLDPGPVSSRGGEEMTAPLYFEDLAVGQTFGTDTVTVEPEMIKSFAAEFDPQPFHMDEEAARGGFFGGLVASGWHTAALSMGLLVGGELKIVGGLIGMGAEELRWPRPVRPGDVLRVESEVLGLRASRSQPDRGIVRVRNTTLNQDGQAVMVLVVNMIVPRRPS